MSEDNLLLFFVSEQENQFNILLFHVYDFVNDLITWCDSAASCDKKHSLCNCCEVISDYFSMGLVIKLSQRTFNCNSVSNIQGLNPCCQLSTMWEIWVYIGSVNFKENIQTVFLWTWWNWCVFMSYLLSLWILPSLQVFHNLKVFANL